MTVKNTSVQKKSKQWRGRWGGINNTKEHHEIRGGHGRRQKEGGEIASRENGGGKENEGSDLRDHHEKCKEEKGQSVGASEAPHMHLRGLQSRERVNV